MIHLLPTAARLPGGALLLWLALLANPARAQTCFFADDYSNPGRWTQLNTGIEVASGAVQVTNTSGGSVPDVQRGIFQAMPQALPDGGGWRLELDLDYRTVGLSGGLFVVAVAAGNQHPLNIYPGGIQTITPQDFIGINNTGSPGIRPIPLTIFASDNGVWHQSAPLDLRLNALSYIRLERLNSGMLKLSVFENAARTIHQSGSPICYIPPGQYTNLSTVWHANLPQGSPARNDNATLDNLCLSTIPVLDTAFTAQASATRICLGQPVTLTSPNDEYSPVGWATTAPNGAGWTGSGATVTYTPPVAGLYTFTASGVLTRFCNRPRGTSFTVEVVAPDVASVAYAAPAFCRTGTASVASFTPAGGLFSGSPGLVINATTGQINLAASPPGSHTVTYTSTGFCPDAATTTITITPLDVTTLAYPQAVYCRTGFTPVPTIGPAGGTFSGTPGLVLNPATGVVTLASSTPGAHTITYTSAGPCPTTATFALTILSVDVVAVTYAQTTYCGTGSTAPPVVSPAGGMFSSTPGLVLNPVTGIINLGASTPGTYTVTYASVGTCAMTATFTFRVDPADVASLAYPTATFCHVGTSALPVFSPAGGRFSGSPGLVLNSATGVIDLGASVPGGHTVTYTSSGVCPASIPFALVITPLGVVAVRLADSVFCQAGTTPAPTVLPAGGTFSGTPGLVFDPVTGIVDLARSGLGRHTLTYTTAGACAVSGPLRLRIAARLPAAVTYADSAFCPQGATPVPVVQPRGPGIFTGTAGLMVDARTGIVNLAASTPGPHVITFTADDRCYDPATARLTIGVAFQPELPNVITPNNDGLNETFGLPSPRPAVSAYELVVFNRWGARVYRTTDADAPWGGNQAAPGTYYYLMRFADCAGQARQYNGWVEVLK